MKVRTIITATLAASGMALGAGALAQQPQAQQQPSGSSPPQQQQAPMSKQRSASGIEFVTGGVGDASQQAMREAASSYSLELQFANERGNYVAGVDVSIKDARGQPVLSTTSPGPILLAKLPPGTYQIEASYRNQSRQHRVTVPQQGRERVTLNWPATG